MAGRMWRQDSDSIVTEKWKMEEVYFQPQTEVNRLIREIKKVGGYRWLVRDDNLGQSLDADVRVIYVL